MTELAKEDRTTKAHKIRAFLAKPPRKAAALRLVTLDDEEALTLAIWDEKESWTPALTPEVIDAIENHATEEGAPTVRLKLRFEAEAGNELKALRLVHRNEGAVTGPMSTPAELTGTGPSLVVQMQKHMEVMVRLMLDSQVKVIAQSRETTQHALDMCAQLAQRLADTEGREADAQDKAEEYRRIADKLASAPKDEQEKGVQDFLEIVRPMLPFVMQALAKTPAPPPQ